MRREVRWLKGGLVLGLAGLVLALTAVAGIDDFKLTKAVPADAALAVHCRAHDGQAFVKAQLERVWGVVEKQHFEKDIHNLLKGLIEAQGEDTELFEQHWQQFNDLLLGVEWSSLGQREMAFAMKLGFPTPELVWMGMSAPEKAEANFNGLTALLKALVALAPEGTLTLATQGTGDAVVHSVTVNNSPFPLGVQLARQKDVLLFGLGATMPEQTLALLRGEAGQTLASSERFQAAFKRLPPPTDEFMFFDLSRWLGQVHMILEKATAAADPGGEPNDPKVKALPGKIIDSFDLFEYIAVVGSTSGMKTTTDSIVVLRADAKNRPLYKVLFGNGTLQDPLKYVPQGAENVTVWTGINVRALYDGILEFIRTDVPEGEAALAEWEEGKAEIKTELELDVEKDLIDWIGGGFTMFTMPAESAFKPGGWVVMLSVKDEAKAKEMMGRLFTAIEPMLAQNSGMVDDARIEGAEGFKVIVHPMLVMLPMLPQPTLGVRNGQIFIGSSTKAVKAALATANGESPNFATNARFQKEGLPLEKNLMSVGFNDLSKMGDELGQMLKMIGGFGTLVPQLTQHPVGKTALVMLGKLGTVVQELNFYQSSFSQSTFDGQVIYTKALMNYREPPPKPVATEPAGTQPATEKPAPGGGN